MLPIRHPLLVAVVALLIAATAAQTAAPPVHWAHQLSTNDHERSYAFGVSSDGAGGAVATGYVEGMRVVIGDWVGERTSDQSGRDVWAARFSDAGETLWAVRAGGQGTDEGQAIAPDGEGGAYVTGFFNTAQRSQNYPANFGSTALYSSANYDNEVFVFHVGASSGYVSWSRALDLWVLAAQLPGLLASLSAHPEFDGSTHAATAGAASPGP